MKRIVIIPTFAESPMIRCQIPNLVETIRPDVVIYNEGLFPSGPESTTYITPDFVAEYCSEDGYTGFDFKDTIDAVAEAAQRYPNIDWHLGTIKYEPGLTAEMAYTYAVSNFDQYGITLEEGDVLFPAEADAFHLESDADKITDFVNRLKPDEGISSQWWDFGATQYYVEQRLHPDIQSVIRHRRFAVKFGTMEFYRSVAMNFVSQNYSNTSIVDLRTYHYPWFRQGKYLDLRYRMLSRQPGYWDAYHRGHEEQIQESRNRTFKESIVIRPTLQGNYRCVKFLDVEHPKAIQDHSCFIK